VKNKTSLRELAEQLGVSTSYLSQVRNGKRPPSQKLLSNADIRCMLTVKQNAEHEIDVKTSKSYNMTAWQRSSGVEQRTHKPLVAGSNPAAATNKHKSSLTDQVITTYIKTIYFDWIVGKLYLDEPRD
jgi:hypothetical protein